MFLYCVGSLFQRLLFSSCLNCQTCLRGPAVLIFRLLLAATFFVFRVGKLFNLSSSQPAGRSVLFSLSHGVSQQKAPPEWGA